MCRNVRRLRHGMPKHQKISCGKPAGAVRHGSTSNQQIITKKRKPIRFPLFFHPMPYISTHPLTKKKQGTPKESPAQKQNRHSNIKRTIIHRLLRISFSSFPCGQRTAIREQPMHQASQGKEYPKSLQIWSARCFRRFL